MEPSQWENRLIEPNLFRLIIDLEAHKAARLRYCVSVVSIAIEGGPADEAVAFTKHVASLVARALRLTDVVAPLSASSFALLLIDAETSALPLIFERAMETVRSHPVSFAGAEWRVRVSAGGACYPRTVATGGELVRQATDFMDRAKEKGSDQLLIPA